MKIFTMEVCIAFYQEFRDYVEEESRNCNCRLSTIVCQRVISLHSLINNERNVVNLLM